LNATLPRRTVDNSARDRKILDGHRAGDTPEVIAVRHGLTSQRVVQILKAAGVLITKKRLPAEDRVTRDSAVVRDYQAGDSTAAIAARWQLTAGRVVQILNKAGVQMR
jgi:hypothetical protein